jgi:exonuclease SbcD
MSQMPLRFVHASDLHLELPPFGVAEVPEHLREVFVESAFWAAERVFAVVLAEEADFLILSGDVLHPQQTGPRGPLFLVEQFERLAERGIAVYWAGGVVDPPEAWPPSFRLPDNVHRFPAQRIELFTHRRDGKPLANVAGVSWRPGQAVDWADFAVASEGLFTIAVVHREPETLEEGKASDQGGAGDFLRLGTIDYWALGGNHARSTPVSDPRTIHWPGMPQGRGPGQIGPHGCTVVRVDPQRRARTTLAPCDVLRWQSERVMVEPTMSRRQLESRIVDRIEALRQSNPGVELMVSWRVVGEGPLLAELRRGSLAGSLLETLRSEHGFGSPAVWSLELTAEPPPILPASWYEQQTILGDFLRELRRRQEDSDEPLVLEEYLSESQRTGPLASAAVLGPGPRRDQIVREAAMLGCDLLSGEDPTP